MDNDSIRLIIELIVFVITIAGLYYKLKGRIEKTENDILEMKSDVTSNEGNISDINKALADVKVMAEQVKVIFNMLNDQSATIEKNQDRVLASIDKLFDKLENKQDKK